MLTARPPLAGLTATALVLVTFGVLAQPRGPGSSVQPDANGECPPGTTETRPGRCQKPEFPPPSILDYRPRSTLVTDQHLVPKAKFPVVDIHSHTGPTPDTIERLVGELDAPFRLKDRLDSAKRVYDVIVIDTPPTLGLITVNALVASTHLIIPIQSSYFALEGTDDLLETVQRIKARPNPQLEVLGVLVTLHDRRTTLSRDIYDHIKQVFGAKVFDTSISRSVRLEESPAYRESIFTFAPGSTGALDYSLLCDEVLQRV